MQNAFFILDSRTTPPPSHSPSSPSSPISPTSCLMDQWNPMSDDHSSLRNAYNVETDNLDVAITGYGKVILVEYLECCKRRLKLIF